MVGYSLIRARGDVAHCGGLLVGDDFDFDRALLVRGLVVERFASEPFEKGWITDGQIEKFDEVAEAVKRVVSKSGTRTKNVAMAMPQSAVITKKIMLPAGLREEELELQVESEANQYIPFSLDEVSLDFCVIGPSATSIGDVEVLIAASRKDRVQDRQGLAEAAG